MTEKAHALLGPSGASRWLACTPSARLEEQFPDTTSEAAAEGTAAHALCELMLRHSLKEIQDAKYKRELAQLQQSKYYDGAMKEHAEDYVVFVLERLAEARQHTPDALLEVEVKLDLTEYVPDGFGTGDAVIIADGTLDLIDMKYGKGVEVSAIENKQMMLYGLGALLKYGYMYGVDTVRMTIFQPRISNYSSWEMKASDLLQWAANVLKPRAAMAFKGEGEYVVGPHCLFCRAKALCKAYADHQLAIDKYQMQHPDLLTDEAVSDVLDRAKDFTSWIKAVEDYALNAAVKDGKKWPGYKLVEGRSVRKITDEESAVKALKALGYSEQDIYAIRLQGITWFEKLMGKKDFVSKIGPYVTKPPGLPTLAPDYDKRPEISGADAAIKDFEDVPEIN
ncbi:MAG: DUF2800 domain-containing protein [Chitinophagaceae bacterium]|nr:DUF2800 domain-containing protein [Chitinophagaceae bacterium]